MTHFIQTGKERLYIRPAPRGNYRCSKCGEARNWRDFYKDENRSNGLMHCCKDCHNATVTKRRIAKRARGECKSCPNKALFGQTLCKVCNDKNNRARRRRF